MGHYHQRSAGFTASPTSVWLFNCTPNSPPYPPLPTSDSPASPTEDRHQPDVLPAQRGETHPPRTPPMIITHLSPLTPLSSPTPVEILATFLRESQGNCFFLSPAFELKCSSNQSCAQEPLCACSEARDGMKTERQCPGQPGSERHPEGQCPPHPPQPHPQAPTCSGGRHLPLGPSHLTCPRL